MIQRLQVLVVLLLCGGNVQAQTGNPYAAGLYTTGRVSGSVGFPSQTAFGLHVGLEWRGLVGWPAQLGLGLRLLTGFEDTRPDVAVDAIYRMDGSAQGRLYLGLGFGYSTTLEGRAVLGYEWRIAPGWRAYFETLVRTGLVAWSPRLELGIGVALALEAVNDPEPEKPNENPQPPAPLSPGGPRR